MVTVSTYAQSLRQAERIGFLQNQMADLQRQLSTGKQAATFKDLGIDIISSKRARAEMASLDTYIRNGEKAQLRMSLMTTALSEIQEQARNLENSLSNQTEQGEVELDAMAELARNVRTFINDLINAKDGDRFLFAGSDVLTTPLGDTGSLETYIRSQITDWAVDESISSDELITNYRDTNLLNDSTVGYSANISSGNIKDVTVRIEERTEINYTVLANAQPFRDLMVATTMIDELATQLDEVTFEDGDPITNVTAPGVDQDAQNDNFFAVFGDLSRMINQAIDDIDDEIFTIGQAQAQVKQITDNHKAEQVFVQQQIDDVENADINAVALGLNSLQIQLEASYRVTASISQLSLVNFL